MNFKEIEGKLKNKKVGIAGCGGLGSNCAIALARSGVGNFILADFDLVAQGNLNRQYYFEDQIGFLKVYALKENLERINPNVQVKPFDIRLCPSDIYELYYDCDIIIEAFDDAKMKQTIIETVLNEMPKMPLVIGNGLAGFGNTHTLKVRKEGNIYICGDEITEISEENPPLAPRVGIVAHMQANVALEVLLAEE
ncbi:MAG: sulfur carrier protein ThiS adenylyltransferase ThiF [Bacteroidales bacterium]|nr:sulfur carrier protein ThiS adenylyltransferase ThiF [Bacteroidales bacterium]